VVYGAVDRGCVTGLFMQLLCWEKLLMMNLKITQLIFLTVARYIIFSYHLTYY